MIVEFLCLSIGTLQSYLMLFAKYTSCKCNLHRKTFLIFNVLLFTSSFLVMGIVYSQFFVIFFIILNRLAHYGQKVRSGALMRTAAMTETRVAWDDDRQHIKCGPGSSGFIKLFITFLDFLLLYIIFIIIIIIMMMMIINNCNLL